MKTVARIILSSPGVSAGGNPGNDGSPHRRDLRCRRYWHRSRFLSRGLIEEHSGLGFCPGRDSIRAMAVDGERPPGGPIHLALPEIPAERIVQGRQERPPFAA